MKTPTLKAKFLHDCNECKLLGHHSNYDIYQCNKGPLETYIARYGSLGQEYCSIPVNNLKDVTKKYEEYTPPTFIKAIEFIVDENNNK